MSRDQNAGKYISEKTSEKVFGKLKTEFYLCLK
jgi:hypothetical protein